MNNNKFRPRSLDPYWDKFLQTGRVEDYINYKIQLSKFQEDVEFAKMDEINGEIDEQRNEILRNRSKDD